MFFFHRKSRLKNPIKSSVKASVCSFVGLAYFSTFLYSMPGFAYIPPSEFILGTWTAKHIINGRVIKLRNVITAFDQGKPSAVRFKEMVIYNPSAGTLTSLAFDDSDQKLFSTERAIDTLPPITKVLLSGDLSKVTESLKAVNIPVRSKEELLEMATEQERILAESESLVRVNGQLNLLAWVISLPKTGSPDHISQIWFEKDTYNPLRLSYQEGRDQTFYEFQIEDFRSFREFVYPKSVQVKKDETLLFAAQMQDLMIGSPESLGVKALRAQNPENGFSELGQSSPSALKGLIQRYYGIVR